MFKSFRMAPLTRATRPSWDGTTIIVMLVMIAAVVIGFVVMANEQRAMQTVSTHMRDVRMARQALMETDAAMLAALARQDAEAALETYELALTKLGRHGPEHFPREVVVRGQAAPTAQAVAALRRSWDEMKPLIAAGRIDDARAVYARDGVHADMAAVVAATITELEQMDAEVVTHQSRIDGALMFVTVLEVLAGAFCIWAVVMSARREERETGARIEAIGSAVETREQVTRLFRMTDMLQSASDHADANAVLTSTAMELLPGYGGALYVFSNSRDRLILSTSWNLGEGVKPVETLGVQHCWALKRGKAHVNACEPHCLTCDHHEGQDAVLEIPMQARGEVLGLLQIRTEGGEGASERLERVAELGAALADAMSLALSNIALSNKLRSQALRDPLTGLYNRRYMEDTLERVCRLAEREKQEVSVIMIDLDHFKRLNDSYGHAKGDSVLRDTAAVLLNHLRESDVACRYGGEELIVVLPNCRLDMAVQKAERLRAAIEALSEPSGAQVSASMGVAAIPSTSVAMRDLVGAADAALYEAKAQGRNRVVAAARSKPVRGKKAEMRLVAAE